MNPDGSKTAYQTDGANHQAIATTTGANGKAQGKIIYKLDADGRYESGQVFAPNGSVRFKTRYRYDAAGRLAEETQLGRDDWCGTESSTAMMRRATPPATRFMMAVAG